MIIAKFETWLKEHWKLAALAGGSTALASLGYLYWRSVERSSKLSDSDAVIDSEYIATTHVSVQEIQETVESEQEDSDELTAEKRDELANSAKSRGNKYYASKKFQKAIDMYTKAIEMYPSGDAKCSVFYSNRAACWAGLNDHKKVIEDCEAALIGDPFYGKAVHRRAVAHEKLDMFDESLKDFTLACFFDEFKNQTLIESADRVLRKLAKSKLADFTSHRSPATELPSESFVKAYLHSFRHDFGASEDSDETLSEGDSLFIKAVAAYKSEKWDDAFILVDESLEHGTKYIAEALNMRGTFYFLLGRGKEARSDFEMSLKENGKLVNTYLKLAGILVEGELETGLPFAQELFTKALEIDSNDPDVYYHRGQIYFLVQDYAKAAKDYDKSIEIDPNFPFARIQRAVVEYRMGNYNKSLKLFDQIRKQFPENSDILFYNGEVLLDHQDVEGASAMFDKAIKLDPKKPLPYVNKAIICSHVKSDVESGIKYTRQAIEVDPRCDLAHMHLAQMYMAQGKIDEAVATYKAAMELSRTELDLENALMGIEASKAQQFAMDYRVKVMKQTQ